MEKCNNSNASLISNKPERKVIEKNRRDKMKYLYSQLFSLVPDHFKSKGTVETCDKISETITYIESQKAHIDKIKDNKDNHGATSSQSFGIQIHEMSPDVDVVLITGLKKHSIFCDITRVLDQCSSGVVQANFSACGPSSFHVQRKKIETRDIYRKLNGLLNGCSKMEELFIHPPPCNEEEGNLHLWDYEISSDVWFRNS